MSAVRCVGLIPVRIYRVDDDGGKGDVLCEVNIPLCFVVIFIFVFGVSTLVVKSV